MERRRLGRTGLEVSVLGFGGSEIGFERAEPGTVQRLLDEALDAGLNVIDNAAARYAVDCGRFDVLQTSVNVADHEPLTLTLPAARAAGLGVIAKRPIANAAWRSGARPTNAYAHVYWDRLQRLRYDFLARPVPESIGVALHFTASLPGVHTLIVGSTRPGRWRENAALMAVGALPAADVDAIR